MEWVQSNLLSFTDSSIVLFIAHFLAFWKHRGHEKEVNPNHFEFLRESFADLFSKNNAILKAFKKNVSAQWIYVKKAPKNFSLLLLDRSTSTCLTRKIMTNTLILVASRESKNRLKRSDQIRTAKNWILQGGQLLTYLKYSQHRQNPPGRVLSCTEEWIVCLITNLIGKPLLDFANKID